MRRLEAPDRLDAERTVLAVLHTAATADNVLDAAELLAADPRVRVVFTHPPGGHLPAAVAARIPWDLAVRTDTDLVVSAEPAGVHHIRAPWLAIPASDPRARPAVPCSYRAGHPLPAALAVAHRDVLPALARHQPRLLPAAVVAGDLCLDRLTRSRQDRAAHRRALGIADGPTLVAVTSTVGPDSLLGRAPAMLFDVLASLPADEFTVAVAVHPAFWYAPMSRPLRAWLERQRQAGLRVVEPARWREVVGAADVLVGDHGQATVYAAAAGVPVLRAVRLPPDAAPGSPACMLAAATPVVRPDKPLAAYLREAVRAFDAKRYASVAAAVSSEPGRAGALLRERMYRLLRLTPPAAFASVVS